MIAQESFVQPDADHDDKTSAAAHQPPVEQGQFAKLVLEAGPLVVFFVANSIGQNPTSKRPSL